MSIPMVVLKPLSAAASLLNLKSEWMDELMNKLMSVRVRERVEEWMNEWESKWMSKWVSKERWKAKLKKLRLSGTIAKKLE